MGKNFILAVLIVAAVSLAAATALLTGNNPETEEGNQTLIGDEGQGPLKEINPYEEVKEFVKALVGKKTETAEQSQLKKFGSYEELTEFLKNNRENYNRGGFGSFGGTSTTGQTFATTAMAESSIPASAADYSATNVQVEGVDEADIVKNDGKYIYALIGRKVIIVDAYPAEEARIVSEVELELGPMEMFVNKDKLVLLAQYFAYEHLGNKSGENEIGIASPAAVDSLVERPYGRPYSRVLALTRVYVYDVSDRARPVLARNITVSGSYYDSRMIGDYVYVVANQPAQYYGGSRPRPVTLPAVVENGIAKEVPAQDIYYFDEPDYSYNYANILAINTQDADEDYNSKTFLAGSAQNMYVSQGNIYITYSKLNYDAYAPAKILNSVDSVVVPILPGGVTAEEKEEKEFEEEMRKRQADFKAKLAKEREKTVVHKIAISDGSIEYKVQGYVPGHVLNQFSMDEHNGYFRIATTTGQIFGGESATARNHIYVLDEDLKAVGTVEDLAPGEQIYSARFMGDRAYLVTFKKIDPLFVIDLSKPENPKVLGKLKIPGYSDYLHPYDENHIIGLGKEAVEAEEGDFAWYQGIKIALFDVSDPENPVEVSKYNIGDRGTDSYALHDHKAFLFSKAKNLLVIPVQLAKIDESKYAGKVPPYAHGDFVWQGAYVFDLDAENGFRLRGRVSHIDEEDERLMKSRPYYSSPDPMYRSLYIDNVLYTVSGKMIKANDLTDLKEITTVKLPKPF